MSIFDSGRLIENSDCIPELGVKTVPVGHRNDEYAGFLNLPYSIEIRRQDDRQPQLDGGNVPKGYAAHSV